MSSGTGSDTLRDSYDGHRALPFLAAATSLPTLDTERLRLRPMSARDVPALYAIFGDPEVCRYWSRPAMPDESDAAALLAHIQRGFAERSLFQWGIALRDGDGVIGTCTLHALEVQHRRAEIGFALGRAHWGRGYIAEALPRLVSYAFSELALHRLEADADPRNAGSIRALERLGFQREGYLRERYHLLGELQDAVVFGLLRREWEAARGSE
jgi:RimJ/RimL family protein N-acetyltransferase